MAFVIDFKVGDEIDNSIIKLTRKEWCGLLGNVTRAKEFAELLVWCARINAKGLLVGRVEGLNRVVYSRNNNLFRRRVLCSLCKTASTVDLERAGGEKTATPHVLSV